MKIRDIIGKNILVRCNTYSKSKRFTDTCRRLDIKWEDGSYVVSDYNIQIGKFYFDEYYGKDTCYQISDTGLRCCAYYCYANNKNYTIIDCDDLELEA